VEIVKKKKRLRLIAWNQSYGVRSSRALYVQLLSGVLRIRDTCLSVVEYVWRVRISERSRRDPKGHTKGV